jgi:phosphonate transport system ATP-binding protein
VRNLSVFHNVYMGRLQQHATLYNLVNLVRPLRREVGGVTRILDKIDMTEYLRTPVGQLSGGQQQRTAVGRALFHGGTVLLGDEPVSSVDAHQARRILSSINESFDTVVLAMHDIELAIAFTDRIIALQDGQVVLDRPTAGMTPADLDPIYH